VVSPKDFDLEALGMEVEERGDVFAAGGLVFSPCGLQFRKGKHFNRETKGKV